MTAAVRIALITVLIVVTVTLQVSIFSHFSIRGVVPDLALLVVISVALVRGPNYAALVGFAAGLVLDLAPPADHTAGRWALSLVLVGYLTGLVKSDTDTPVLGSLLMVASGAFVGTSVFALTGLVLREPGIDVAAAIEVIPVAVGYDLLMAPLVIALVLLFRRLEPAERW